MNGAREFKGLNIRGQHGRLFISMSSHARGSTISIQVLPEGEQAAMNCGLLTHQCLNKDAVEVYGVTGGNRGWTETYGWIHKGPWVEDFKQIVKEAGDKKQAKEQESKTSKEELQNNEKNRVSRLLEAYE